ncbi:hypothetical protein AC578_6430 [Pseudocercospora eumusae]|uniref:Uncharacterized protein n=1 Tax=Pseudocercospora eumusae TaxID=321146 RepID=A0A139GXG4_9PEZI|nr:hypothetical protein AC578_6430 [Pseudocercospora eumusae]KXS94819.1 hypothetical protein AC578_6430 [Pseudocercospora eumusae]
MLIAVHESTIPCPAITHSTQASLFCLTLASICSGIDTAAMAYLRRTLETAILLRLPGENSATAAQLGHFHPHWIRADGYVVWARTISHGMVVVSFSNLTADLESVHMSHYRIAEFRNVSFHSMAMELFRPFLFKNLTLASLGNARPEEVFLASSAHIVEVTRLYYTKFRGTPFTCTATWLIAPIYTANISLRGSADTWVQRKQDFELAMCSLMEIGMIAAMKEAIVRGGFIMAIHYGLLSRGEARAMLQQVLAGKGNTFLPDHPGTVLTIDFERAVDDPANSSAQALLKNTSLLMTEGLHTRACWR